MQLVLILLILLILLKVLRTKNLLRGCLILRVKIGSVAKSRNSDTFRRSRTKSSFPIAIASKLLQYGCCNFVGVLNTAHWPICALNIRQKKIFVVSGTLALGPRGQWQIPIWGRKKWNWAIFSLRHYLGFGGCGSGQLHPVGPFLGPTEEIFGFRLGFREKPFFSGPRLGIVIWAILGHFRPCNQVA
jgi:hypothetical protein